MLAYIPHFVIEVQVNRVCSPCLLLRVDQDHKLLRRLYQQLTLFPFAKHVRLAASVRAFSPVAQPHTS